MAKELSPEQLEFYNRIDEILYYKWDPIGISSSDWARNEYHSYLPRVFSYAMQSESPEPIATYLGVVTTENMGLSFARGHDQTIAELIMEIKKGLGL